MAQAKAVDDVTSGTLTLTAGLSDTAVSFANASGTLAAGVSSLLSVNPNVTITGTAATVAQAKAVDDITSGTLTLTAGLSDTAVGFADVSTGVLAAGVQSLLGLNPNVTITGVASIAQLSAIHNITSGAIITSSTTSLSGLVAEVKSIADAIGTGSNKISIGNMVGQLSNVNVTVSDAASVVQALAIDAATSGTLVFTVGITEVTVGDVTTQFTGRVGDVTTQSTGRVGDVTRAKIHCLDLFEVLKTALNDFFEAGVSLFGAEMILFCLSCGVNGG